MSPRIFTYNRTFAENSVASEEAWEALFPKQKGYFTHPTLAPERSTFSVFHYLHCLVKFQLRARKPLVQTKSSAPVVRR